MKRLLLSFIIVASTLFSNIMAKDNPRAIIIFDASGSMWGQINGIAKIKIAKDALKKVVKNWNPDVQLGLTVYGHRRKGDCNDIQSVVPVGAVDKARIIKSVMAISPKGKTPISRSIKKAANELKYTEDKATVILISDGKETCDPDPCGTAKELKREGIDFVAHVIGFNVDKATDKQLQCIANATGGEYFSAKNANALNRAIKKVVKKVEKPKKPVVVSKDGKVYITARETEGGKLVYSNCRLYNEDKSDSWHLSSRRKNPQSNTLKLPIGKYTANCSYNEFDKKDIPFEVKAGETAHFDVVFGQTGKVYVTARETEGGKLVYSNCRLYNEDKSDSWHLSSRRKNPQSNTLKLPVGKYTANCSYNEFDKKDIPFEVKAGETAHIDVVFAPFHVNVKGITPCAKIHFEVISSNGETVYEKDSPAYKGIEFIALKGKYTIESSFPDKKIKTKIDIGKGQNSATVDFGGDDTLNGIEGVWKTNEGRATIALNGKRVHGYYNTDNGELIGEMTYPKRFEGYWIEDNSNEKCSTAKNGRYYWGKVIWKFDDKMCSFKGKWSYCNKTLNSSWRGSYIRPLSDDDRHKLLIKDDASSNSKVETKTVAKEESQNSKEANKNNPQTIKIGDKIINIEGLSDKQIKKLKDMQKMLEMFGNKK